jgi:hypothetical protein
MTGRLPDAGRNSLAHQIDMLLAPGRGFSASSVNYGTAGKDIYSEMSRSVADPWGRHARRTA